MKQWLSSVYVLAAGAALAAFFQAQAADLYVGPNGTPSGPGTQSQPYDLVTALSGSVGQAGDTFWLRGGVHRIGHVDTQIHGAAGRPITFRQMPGERAQVVGSFTVWGNGGYVVFRDFELYSGETRRLSSQIGVGFSPTDLPNFVAGIQAYAPNFSFINLVVHDAVGSGFYTAHEATNTLIYGCLVYNTGWVSPDNAEGHSYYLQGPGEVSDNLAFNSAGANFHFYGNGKGSYLENLTADGNVAFGAGALQTVRAYRDWIVGVDAPSVMANNIVLRNNMGYLTANPTTLTQVQIGREQLNGSVVLSSNYWPMEVVMNNWSNASVSSNVLSAGRLTGTKVFVRPNRYEAGRANIVVYNWDNLSSVPVDVSSVLPVGTQYEVRNAQNFYGPAVLSGVFDGQAMRLPMTGLTVAAPMAPLLTPAPTGPTFNVFVLLPLSSIRNPNGYVFHSRKQS